MEEIIKKWILNSLKDLFECDDINLIDRELKEECINHRLAVYLERNKPEEYCGYYIDLEYNKNCNSEKAIIYLNVPKYIRPDILIHKRLEDINDNLVAFECKKGYLNKNDKIKLRGLKKDGYNYRVCIGISYQPNKDYFLLYSDVNNFKKPKHIKKYGLL